ncbi:ABC-2 transporter permease [uncultured Ruthenibacterium sp.]|uniref:ABC-2 transporter permease n=1 Tax=uncultured Ruthenibacterium sp. TaxID=1905347 RepID=UPI00349E50CC
MKTHPILGLMLKDFYSIRGYLIRQIGLLLVIYLIIGFAMKTMSMLPSMLMLGVTMSLISIFSLDETSHWNAYALTLPITPKDLVVSKYVLYYGAMYIVGLLASLFSAVLDFAFFREAEDSIETLIMGVGGGMAILIVYTLVIAVDIPLFLKLGTEKSRIPMTLTFLVPFVAIFPTISYWGPWLENLDYTQINWILVSLIALIILIFVMVISCMISIQIMAQKEY